MYDGRPVVESDSYMYQVRAPRGGAVWLAGRARSDRERRARPRGFPRSLPLLPLLPLPPLPPLPSLPSLLLLLPPLPPGESDGAPSHGARSSSLQCQLGYVQNGDLPDLETDVWEGRDAVFTVAMLDPDSLAIIDTVEIFRGQMDTLSVEVKATDSVVTLTVVNEMTKLKQSWGATYSVADSLAGAFPDDTSMRFLPNIQGKNIQL